MDYDTLHAIVIGVASFIGGLIGGVIGFAIIQVLEGCAK